MPRMTSPQSNVPAAPAPGWYPDPHGRALHRYWDGSVWTDHTAPTVGPPGTSPVAQPAPSANHGPSSAVHWLVPVGRSWQSLVAGYLGFVAIFCVFFGIVGVVVGLIAIGIGIWALVEARNGGHGRGRAIFAIVGGAIGAVGGMLVLAVTMTN